MTSIADGSVIIQTCSDSVPSPPAWFGEVVLLIGYLRKQGVLTRISERVRFARRRFGRYEVIDFLAVLFGYAISGERTVEAFYQRLQPFAVPFMALFGRDQLPARSTLSRFLAALTAEPIDALRVLFLEDLESRSLSPDNLTAGLVDRTGNAWVVFDVDGTREAARKPALPQTEALPVAFRRLDDVCAPGYTGSFTGADFPLQPDGTLRCPAGKPLHLQEQRREADGNLRLVYAASIRHCCPCPLRKQCQWNGSATAKPRQVSILLHPLCVGPAPLLWR